MKNKPFAIWLTGLPGSGKSVISDALKNILNNNGIDAYILRMDEVRDYVTPEPKYTDEERQLIYNAFAYMAKLLVDHGVNVIMDATGNLRKYRDLALTMIPNIYITYLKCPLDVAMEREAKRQNTKKAPENIYKKAMEGKAETVPGLQTEYQKPLHPDLIINTDKNGIEESAEKIFSLLVN